MSDNQTMSLSSRVARLWVRRVASWAALLLTMAQLSYGERLPLKAFTTADGLPHNGINKIVHDSRGFLWFCTEEGLSRFDGYTFTNYGVEQGLPHRVVNDFLETRSGEVWLATNAGLVRFDPKGFPGNRVVYANEALGARSMFTVVVPDDEERTARVVNVLLEGRDGTIWCGTMKHLYRLERPGGRFDLRPVDIGVLGQYPQQVGVLDLLEDHNGSLWMASFNGLLRRRPDGSTQQYTKHEGLPDNTIHDLLKDHQGRLWAGTRHGGLFQFEAGEKDVKLTIRFALAVHDLEQSEWVSQIFESSDHKLWAATARGLLEFTTDNLEHGRRYRLYTKKNGLSDYGITALNEDTGGNLWLGTASAGAMKLARSGFVTYDEQDGLLTVNAIFENSSGEVCFRGNVLGDKRRSVFEGAKLDLLREEPDSYHVRFGCFDGRRFDWFKPAVPFDFGWVLEHRPVQTRNGEWWLGSKTGLYRFPAADSFTSVRSAQPLAVYATRDGLAGPVVWRVFADSGSNVWVSTASTPYGLARWDQRSGTLHNLANSPGLPSLQTELPGSFGEDRDGNIWVGLTTGVARYRDGRFRFFNAHDGLPPGAILNIHLDRAGRLWLTSSRGGLIRVDQPAAEQPAFTIYSSAQGLSGNGTEAIAEDLQGRIYISTARGLDQLEPTTGRIRNFTTTEGFPSGKVVAAFRDSSGVLWFGTTKGLARFVPPVSEGPAPPPPILITGIDVGGRQQPISALGEREISLSDLAADRNQLRIDFVGLGFASGEVLRYQYLMEGSSAGWSAASEQRTVTLASLAPGRYRFLVRAVNADGGTSAAPAIISFTILRPFWQRWWFISLIALAMLALGYAVYRYRKLRQVELERVRARIATDLHDDIGAGLSRIAVLSEVARHEAGSPVNERLSTIACASRELVDSMSDIVWVINPERDQLRDLTQRMRRFASDVFAARETGLIFRVPGPEQQLKVGADVRRQVFLIFKEAINNIARHADCTTVEVELTVESHTFALTVRDNGCGFNVSTAGDGNGLASMRMRAQLLGGELQLDSKAGQGTTLILRAPLKATIKDHNTRLHGILR